MGVGGGKTFLLGVVASVPFRYLRPVVSVMLMLQVMLPGPMISFEVCEKIVTL